MAALRLLENEGFQEAFADLMRDLQEEWITCQTAEEREQLHVRVNGLQEIAFNLAEKVQEARVVQETAAAQAAVDEKQQQG